MSPIRHRNDPQAHNEAKALHECSVCGHAVSESWWREGYDTCSLHSLGVKPKKRKLQTEGDAM